MVSGQLVISALPAANNVKSPGRYQLVIRSFTNPTSAALLTGMAIATLRGSDLLDSGSLSNFVPLPSALTCSLSASSTQASTASVVTLQIAHTVTWDSSTVLKVQGSDCPDPAGTCTAPRAGLLQYTGLVSSASTAAVTVTFREVIGLSAKTIDAGSYLSGTASQTCQVSLGTSPLTIPAALLNVSFSASTTSVPATLTISFQPSSTLPLATSLVISGITF